MRRRQQSGQVLVGTLVIMILVFAMAGSLALAVSSLLDRQSSHRSAVDGDLRASDSLGAAVSRVAGRGLDSKPNGATCETQNSELFTVPLTAPLLSPTVNCLRFDEVSAPPTLESIVLPWVSGCATAALGGSPRPVWIFFSALGTSGAGATGVSAWVDDDVVCKPGEAQTAPCAQTVPPTNVAPTHVAQVAINCALTTQTHMLHVRNQLPSPVAARVVASAGLATSAQRLGGDNSGGPGGKNSGGPNENAAGQNEADTSGSIYQVAATTGLPAGQQWEEGAVFVSRDGKTTTLLVEGSL